MTRMLARCWLRWRGIRYRAFLIAQHDRYPVHYRVNHTLRHNRGSSTFQGPLWLYSPYCPRRRGRRRRAAGRVTEAMRARGRNSTTCSSSLSTSIHLALKISKNCWADTMPEDSRSIRDSNDLRSFVTHTKAHTVCSGSLDLCGGGLVA
jgi:hypothetical protein